jgi:CXCXC repeat
MTRPHIVFVYNADSGIFNTASDIAHKIFSPETCSCNLYAITYGNFSIRTKWKEYLETLDVDLEFLHRNELVKKYGVKSAPLPAVFLKIENSLQEWISADIIKKCHNIKDLKMLISWKLSLLRDNQIKY